MLLIDERRTPCADASSRRPAGRFRRRDGLVALGRAAGALVAASVTRTSLGTWQTTPDAYAATPAVVRPGAPIALRIAAAGIDAAVEPVWQVPAIPSDGGGAAIGITGALDAGAAPTTVGLPSAPGLVGWYALGAVPGT